MNLRSWLRMRSIMRRQKRASRRGKVPKIIIDEYDCVDYTYVTEWLSQMG